MNKIRIFIVDDSIAARTILSKLLSSQEDFQIVGEAGTGQAGIIMLDEFNPDVVMLEASITGGMAITDIVKEIKNINPIVKIILCTDNSSLEHVIPAAEAGADDFISKPYKKEHISRIIRQCMSK